jgi:hypothetical protein
MKNLPDDELFRKLQDDLRGFEEEPDEDVWERISGAIPRGEPTWVKWADRTALSLALLLFAGVMYENLNGSPAHDALSANVSGGSVTTVPDGQTSVNSIPGDAGNEIGEHSDRLIDALQAPTRDDESMDNASGSGQDRTLDKTDPASHRPLGYPRKQGGAHNKGEGQDHHGKSQATFTAPDAIRGRADHVVPLQERQAPSAAAPVVDGTQYVGSPAEIASAVSSQESRIESGSRYDNAAENGQPPVADNSMPVPSVDSVENQSSETIIRPSQRTTRSLRLYVVGTPSLSFQQVMPSTTDNVSFLRLNSPGVLSAERLSMSFEAGMQLPVARRLVVLAGLTWYQQSNKISLDQVVEGQSSFNPSRDLNFVVSPVTVNTTVNYVMRNVGATAGLAYAISVRKLVHQLGASLQYEVGLRSGSRESYDNASATYLNYRIFYRVEYAVTERIGVFVQPAFVQSLHSDVVLDGAIRLKQTNAGVGLGALYRF